MDYDDPYLDALCEQAEMLADYDDPYLDALCEQAEMLTEVDDPYLDALCEQAEALYEEATIFSIFDQKYPRKRQLHESASSSSKKKPSKSPNSYCGICMDSKSESEMFQNTNGCRHLFCSDCIRSHVAAKIKENITNVKCPDPECKAVIRPETCRSVVPKQVLERWETALCDASIEGSEKFYCSFKDCSAMLVDDGCGRRLTSSECPYCNRLFCVQCKVAWHSGMDCLAYKRSKKGDEREDILLMELAKNKKWRRCPKCRFYVERIDGCLHISCRCGFQFCYGCGKEHNSRHVCASV